MIEIKDGSLSVKNRQSVTNIIENINLIFENGKNYALIGVNGSGKSTLLKILAGRVSLSKGLFLFNGQPTFMNKLLFLKQVGWVNQDPLLDIKLTGMETLTISSQTFGMSKKDFLDSFDFLNQYLKLSDFIKSKVSTLSGGQKRRLDLARSLIHNPNYLFLDEPSAGFDPLYFNVFWNFIKIWKTEKKSNVIAITHNIKEAEILENIIVMSNGHVLLHGTYNNLTSTLPLDMIEIETSYPNELTKKFEKNTSNKSIITYTDRGIRIGSHDSKYFLDFLTSTSIPRKLWSRFSLSQTNLNDVISYAENI